MKFIGYDFMKEKMSRECVKTFGMCKNNSMAMVLVEYPIINHKVTFA